MPGKTSRVAVAGGAAPGVGRTIADALVENGYEVVILTRRSTVDSTSASTSTNSPGFKKQQNHYTVRPIDYDDISDILSVLDADRIDTLISTIPSGLPIITHLNLLEAAKRSSTVKRYIPSNWGAGDEVNSKVDRFRCKHEALKMLRNANNANGLEFTCILPGQYFMNYLAQGSPKNLHGEAMSGLYDFSIPVDVSGRTAEVGGSGDEPLVFTRLEDLAQGVVQVLEEEKWEYDATWVVGDVVCWNEVIRLAERILNTKFSVTYLPLKDLETRAARMTPGSKEQMLVQLQACSARGELRPSPTHGTDKVKVIRPRGAKGVKEFLEEWWGA